MAARIRRAVAGRCVACACALALAGCDDGDLRTRPGELSSAASSALFADDTGPEPGVPGRDEPIEQREPASAVEGTSLLGATARLSGASADVDEIDVAIDWSLGEAGLAAVGSDTRLEAALIDASGERRSLARTRVRPDRASGRLDLVLPLPLRDAEVVLTLSGLVGVEAGSAATRLAVDLPAVVSPVPLPLDRLESLTAELVPGSATSSVEAGRRLHRFTVRVDGTLDGRGPVAVTGLDADVPAHFRVREGGTLDPESPVRAAWQSEPIAVYLVLDTSASIVLAGAADLLLDAVARTLGALAPVATFDYRTASAEVRSVRGLREITFDTDEASGSGTAFHHAVETVIDDIERRGEAHAVLIGFTDGRDFASRNFHPEFGSEEQVLRHVASRLRRLRDARESAPDASFVAHFASLGSDIDLLGLEALADAGGGTHVASDVAGALEAAFDELTAGLRGVYRLEYSSQRLAGDAPLQLEVDAGELSATIALP